MSEAASKYVYLKNVGSYIGWYSNDIAPYMVEPMDTLTSRKFTGVVFVGPAQSAKALRVDTPIATPDGWTTMGRIEVGDTVFGDDGTPVLVNVVSPLTRGKNCYRMTFDDRSELTMDEDHLWTVTDHALDQRTPNSREITLDAKTIAATYRWRNNRFRYSIANAGPLFLPNIPLAVSPYTLGCWLGDGDSTASQIHTHRDDAWEMADRIAAEGYAVDVENVSYREANTAKILLDPAWRAPDKGCTIRQAMYSIGVLRLTTSAVNRDNFKHIPGTYLRAGNKQRLELLRGLMDTDGTCSKSGVCSFTTVLSHLADQVNELLVSLGYKVRRSDSIPTYNYSGQLREGQRAYKLSFVAYRGTNAPFALTRKLDKLGFDYEGRPTYTGSRRIENVECVSSVPVRCIGVDNTSHLFLAGRQMVPTHNTQALILNYLAYSVVVDGLDTIIYSPTQTAARDFSQRRVDRMHRDSPAVGNMLATYREADNVHDKHYRNGLMLNLSWPTVAEFAGKPIGRVALTDYDRMPDDIGGEGAPFDLASKRTTTFRSYAMTVAESSPSRPVENPKWFANSPHEAPPCKGILGLYNRGDRRRWYWPCPHCSVYFEGKWEQLQWTTRDSVLASAETVRLMCPSCGNAVQPNQRQGMQDWGVWLKDGQTLDENGKIVGKGVRATIASFWMNGIAAAFTTWQQLVVTYLNAMAEYAKTGSEDALAKFWNTDLGMPYISKNQESELVPEVLKSRASKEVTEDMPDERLISRVPMLQPTVPARVRFLIANIDVQNNLFVVQVHGISPGIPFDVTIVDRFQLRKSLRLDAQGDPLWVKPSTYAEDWDLIIQEVMERTYPLSDGSGRRMTIRYTTCDSGGREGVTGQAYNFYRRLRNDGKAGRFHLIKGDKLASRPRTQITFPDSGRKDKLSLAKGDVPLMLLNSNLLKDDIRGRLESTETGKGRIHFPGWLPDFVYSELCVEVRNDKGWENPRNLRNESWDLLYYCIGAAMSVYVRTEGLDWEKPPGWAAEWDSNDMVTKVDAKVAVAFQSQTKYNFAELAEQMA